MADKLWWKKPMRVIQDNLQVADTPKMDPVKIARETQEMHADVLVINAGGIYAWYPSKVRYHHVNEYLPKDFDLFGRLIEEGHKRGIRVVARFDFSKTDDYVSQERPEWFVRNPDGTRRAYPEFDDVERLAAQGGLATQDVWQAAMGACAAWARQAN